jgi:hypothetical protein
MGDKTPPQNPKPSGVNKSGCAVEEMARLIAQNQRIISNSQRITEILMIDAIMTFVFEVGLESQLICEEQPRISNDQAEPLNPMHFR